MKMLPKLEGARDAMRLIFSNVRPNIGRAINQKMIQSESGAEYSRILMYGPIVDDPEMAAWLGGVSPQDFANALDESADKPIVLRINSPGGSAFAGRAIQNLIVSHPMPITGVVDGLAASAAIFPVLASVAVYMGDGARLMIHRAWTFSLGNAIEMRKTADLLDAVDIEAARSIAEKTGQDDAAVIDQLSAETWIGAEDAISLGYADGMLVDWDQYEFLTAPPQEKIRWDISAYTHAPEDYGPPTQQQPETDKPAQEPAPDQTTAKVGEVPDYVRRQFEMLDIDI